jgi:hypothetical protein
MDGLDCFVIDVSFLFVGCSTWLISQLFVFSLFNIMDWFDCLNYGCRARGVFPLNTTQFHLSNKSKFPHAFFLNKISVELWFGYKENLRSKSIWKVLQQEIKVALCSGWADLWQAMGPTCDFFKKTFIQACKFALIVFEKQTLIHSDRHLYL